MKRIGKLYNKHDLQKHERIGEVKLSKPKLINGLF